MIILGWLVAIGLIISILVSMSVAIRLTPLMPHGYFGRMVFIQGIKGLIAFFIIRAISN